ncbi:MAG: DUF2079 domain-containing protein [Candidatus Omnitrophica bacterium]|nr:DUF2079 domain-containing protein [Candidatus Omnitrophota bacterium]
MLHNFPVTSCLLFLIFCLLFYSFIICLRVNGSNPNRALVILLPIALLLFWPAEEINISIAIPFLIVIATQAIFYKILLCEKGIFTESNPPKEKIVLSAIIIIYILFFSLLSIPRFNAFAVFNPKDFGLFNQIFWNTIHGRFYLNSTYGSHFAGHNSLFFVLLMPFYYLFPHPHTLLILKTSVLAFSAIPFYLIVKDILKQSSALPLAITFIFFPFIAGQNFTSAHEMGFAPLFILFTYYFFRKKKFIPFLCFLLITISIKETLALLALMFGIYAFFKKRGAVWVIYPALIGIVWFFSSIALISHFFYLYHPSSDSAWYLVYLKKAFLEQNKNGPLSTITYLFSNSNLAHWPTLKSAISLFFTLGLAPSLLSSVILLGLPELFVNLVSSNSNMFSPYWHYSTTLSCFILIGVAEGIKKISSFLCGKEYFKISEHKLQSLLCVSVLSCTLIHSYLWIKFAEYKLDAVYVRQVNEALALVPPDASISVPLRIVTIVSSREKYSIAGPDPSDDYILVDSEAMQKELKTGINSDYSEIFRKDPIVLYKRK